MHTLVTFGLGSGQGGGFISELRLERILFTKHDGFMKFGLWFMVVKLLGKFILALLTKFELIPR